MSRVYIKTDSRMPPCVTACEGGYAEPRDLIDWKLVDEGTGDRYNLCQSHYFPGGLYTMDGIPRYKYADGVCSLRLDSEIAEDRAAIPTAPSQLDSVEAQSIYTAMMTDTLLEG